MQARYLFAVHWYDVVYFPFLSGKLLQNLGSLVPDFNLLDEHVFNPLWLSFVSLTSHSSRGRVHLVSIVCLPNGNLFDFVFKLYRTAPEFNKIFFLFVFLFAVTPKPVAIISVIAADKFFSCVRI